MKTVVTASIDTTDFFLSCEFPVTGFIVREQMTRTQMLAAHVMIRGDIWNVRKRVTFMAKPSLFLALNHVGWHIILAMLNSTSF